jgi:hypothetical protein
MDTDSPGPVVAQIGAIEDGLASEQNMHAEAKALNFRHDQELKLLRATLYADALGDNKDARDAWVLVQISESETYSEWLTVTEQLHKHAIRLEYLSKRLSACQSVLKRFELDSSGRYGQAASRNG